MQFVRDLSLYKKYFPIRLRNVCVTLLLAQNRIDNLEV